MGGDGTVGANKNSIKIIADNSEKHVQGYFEYDAKKAGGLTVSHLRFSDKPIRASYLVTDPDFIAIHKQEYLNTYNMLKGIREGGTVLINSDLEPSGVFAAFTVRDQKTIIDRKLKLYTIDASRIADEEGLGGRTNTTLQAAFFAITDILDEQTYTAAVEKAIKKTYAKLGEEVVRKNIEAFRRGKEEFQEVSIPDAPVPSIAEERTLTVKPEDRAYQTILKQVIEPVMHFEGDSVPVSSIPPDGVFPTGTTKYEKRNVATHLPEWDPSLCVQCGFCSFSCPHASILARVNAKSDISLSSREYSTIPLKAKGATDEDRFRIQVAPDDCTGCGVCVNICRGKDRRTGKKALTMKPKRDLIQELRTTYREFLRLPETEEKWIDFNTIRGSQLARNYFEFSGACPGCGETPYVKLVTQLCGDRMIQANATGCSSIYGGTAPISPFTRNELGRGPAWASSLFEDNAEYGFGMRLALDKLHDMAFALAGELLEKGSSPDIEGQLRNIRPVSEQVDRKVYEETSRAVDRLRELLKGYEKDTPEARLLEIVDYLKEKVIWIVGGDGWAYDIGYGGLDHVVASGQNVNMLVLDTEVYSNTGGQRSKATPLGGVVKFAAAGKETGKKDLGLMCMNYGSAYVASVNFGANPTQTLRAIREAIEFPGTSLVIAYSNCIEHGIDMSKGPDQAKLADQSGYWICYRFDPRRKAQSLNPLQLDTREPSVSLEEFLHGQRRFQRLMEERPDTAQALFQQAEREAKARYSFYKRFAEMPVE
jgi:pyruvate-ferredoxin/flavodoxin oxidoreductase